MGLVVAAAVDDEASDELVGDEDADEVVAAEGHRGGAGVAAAEPDQGAVDADGAGLADRGTGQVQDAGELGVGAAEGAQVVALLRSEPSEDLVGAVVVGGPVGIQLGLQLRLIGGQGLAA